MHSGTYMPDGDGALMVDYKRCPWCEAWAPEHTDRCWLVQRRRGVDPWGRPLHGSVPVMSEKRLTQCDGCGMSGQNLCRDCRARFFTVNQDSTITVDHDQRTRSELRAQSSSLGGWGEVASDTMTRYAKPFPRMRRRCGRGEVCANRATHCGMANGLALMSGCEFHVTQWVRDGWTER